MTSLGTVVQSLHGRDRYRLFIITGITSDGRVLIADGKLHKREAPKKKNLCHLKISEAGAGRSREYLLSLDDEALFKALQDFEANKNL